jgi:hypothetical protein
MEDFKMSDGLRTQLESVMEGMSSLQRELFFSMLVCFATEVQLAVQKVALEKMRKDWSDVLQTMLMKCPLPRR